MRSIERVLKLMMALSLALAVLAWFKREALPAPTELSAELQRDPVQEQVRSDARQALVGGVQYTIKPLYRYEMWGLVVSRHDAKSFWDIAHKEWNDHLNVADLCVVYGANVKSGVYTALDYWSDQWTCWVRANSGETMSLFSGEALSNNHLLTDSKSMAKKLRNVRIGDQIRLSGYLAEYSHNHGRPFHRGTSTTRTDTGNGACETIYVEDLQVLRAGGGPWRALWWVALGTLLASVIGWFMVPYRATD